MGVLVMGVSGYMIIEGYSFIEAIYMTVITVTTVGFNEVRTLTEGGRIFTIFLILTSFGNFAYAISVFTQSILSGEIALIYTNRIMKRKLDSLQDHVIVCGYGRVGRQAVSKLMFYKQKIVVIDEQEIEDEDLRPDDVIFIQGDSTKDDLLLEAGVRKAKAVITALPSDADNLYVVLSVREMRNDILIISRVSNERSNSKLKAAGANNTIMPDHVGGAHIASLVVTPDVVEFLDHISVEGEASINLEEISVDNIPESYRARKISDLEIRKQTGCTVIGYKTTEGEYVINPGAEMELLPSSKLFVLGRPEQINELNEMFKNQ
jgi:voltage-gated potassium channel